VKNFVEYIGGIAPEKAIVPGIVIGGGISRRACALRRVADKLSRLGKYFRVLAGNRGRVFDFRVDIFLRGDRQHDSGGQGLADAETFPPLQFRTDKIFISLGGSYRKNFRHQASTNRRFLRGGEQFNLHEERH